MTIERQRNSGAGCAKIPMIMYDEVVYCTLKKLPSLGLRFKKKFDSLLIEKSWFQADSVGIGHRDE